MVDLTPQRRPSGSFLKLAGIGGLPRGYCSEVDEKVSGRNSGLQGIAKFKLRTITDTGAMLFVGDLR
jgi:hypothetical protein